jgi:hypothetical protein
MTSQNAPGSTIGDLVGGRYPTKVHILRQLLPSRTRQGGDRKSAETVKSCSHFDHVKSTAQAVATENHSSANTVRHAEKVTQTLEVMDKALGEEVHRDLVAEETPLAEYLARLTVLLVLTL